MRLFLFCFYPMKGPGCFSEIWILDLEFMDPYQFGYNNMQDNHVQETPSPAN